MKKKIIICIYGLIILSCISCSNYLDIKPYGRTIPKTAEEFSALLHTWLNKIDGGSDDILVGNSSNLMNMDGAYGDDFEVCLTAQSGRFMDVYLGDLASSTKVSENYSNLYEIIRDCNIVLNEMEESVTTEANEVRATAYTMRAVAYYQLLRFYCETPQTGNFENQLGVPLVVTFDMEEKPIRSTMQETIDLIESDLNHSISYHISNELYRFTEDVTKGYLARLYFWTRQWGKALPLTQELLIKYALLEGDAYKSMMTTSYDLAGNQLLKAYRAVTDMTEMTGSRTMLQYRPVSKRFLNTFTEEEKVKDMRYALWVNNKRVVTKTFFCGMRAAEFKLMEAECYYHLDKLELALNSINELRAHRINDYKNLTMNNLPSLQETEIITIDAEGNALTLLMGLILRERRKELFLEGDRFFEQKRNGMPEYWTAYNGRKYVTRKYMYTLPIPPHELNLVNGLVQNPGYTELK
ncbi:RagB/SusD family nutrient uptake outer membrane protein [Bacteroides sp. GM023]|uniref:RagB/SusD family nutrient uptake outer membrane protein n=1 Tax=Bacteroides sp. GM023 TaxID=2723058 RepID=UPI00168AE316|nr:RagB/SusD family nutrient uptake outer membrane protein [Bacteroides sp. GM023]MBD3588473.1 RagB/SusD family nutrient uptake outer membrane protein [Bacteroides sp. GM023]